jgi:hypothetical protein
MGLFLVPVADDVARSRALAGPVPSCDGDRETVVQGNGEAWKWWTHTVDQPNKPT